MGVVAQIGVGGAVGGVDADRDRVEHRGQGGDHVSLFPEIGQAVRVQADLRDPGRSQAPRGLQDHGHAAGRLAVAHEGHLANVPQAAALPVTAPGPIQVRPGRRAVLQRQPGGQHQIVGGRFESPQVQVVSRDREVLELVTERAAQGAAVGHVEVDAVADLVGDRPLPFHPLVEPEEHPRRPGARPRHVPQGQPLELGHLLGCVDHHRWLAALAPEGRRRHEGPVGLQQQGLVGDPRDGVRQLPGVPEGHHPRYAQVPPALQHLAGKFPGVGVAVNQHLAVPGPLLVQDREALVLGGPAVDHDRQVPFARHADLLPEDRSLGIPGGPVAEEVEPDLPPGDDLRLTGHLGDAIQNGVGHVPGLVGVNAHSRPHPLVAPRQLEGAVTAPQPVTRADHDHLADPRVVGALDHLIEVSLVPGRPQVDVGIEQLQVVVHGLETRSPSGGGTGACPSPPGYPLAAGRRRRPREAAAPTRPRTPAAAVLRRTCPA